MVVSGCQSRSFQDGGAFETAGAVPIILEWVQEQTRVMTTHIRKRRKAGAVPTGLLMGPEQTAIESAA